MFIYLIFILETYLIKTWTWLKDMVMDFKIRQKENVETALQWNKSSWKM